MKFRHKSAQQDKTELSMTSMIDIVFLLLVFFVMTFKISAQEGDFNVKMPLQDSGAPVDNTQLPLKLRLIADNAGNLQQIVLNDSQSFGTDWEQVRAYIVQLVGDQAGPSADDGPEVEIDLDYNLHYAHVIEAITAVTGYRSGNDVVRLVDRIKFAKQRK
ncbi:MAG: biopolymer transporter ExbD [Planctomycetales bacterium]|nr:biopolymer transporter ExbD [Planctomycetales bacterium]